jgi:hypothetical protein
MQKQIQGIVYPRTKNVRASESRHGAAFSAEDCYTKNGIFEHERIVVSIAYSHGVLRSKPFEKTPFFGGMIIAMEDFHRHSVFFHLLDCRSESVGGNHIDIQFFGQKFQPLFYAELLLLEFYLVSSLGRF